ncbi:hypothetical protein FDECE_4293 [Fusarium decemcellulare]|nr:hypothetical protein FDECE_4293 [Fusarium decemcellulare]
MAYSPLEGNSDYASSSSSRALGGLSMLQILRYRDSPVGAYDEMILAPGSFEYEREDQSGRRIKRRNPKITRIYVSQRDTCYNGRKNWNVPKHLARFAWTSNTDGSTTVQVYPHDTVANPDSASESSSPSPVPFFQATFKPIRFAPSFPFKTTWVNYLGFESTLVLPPLPAGSGSQDELPGTDRWCSVVPQQSSSRCSLGWFDVAQHRDDEGKLTGEFDNFWPGWGRWQFGIKMDDAVIKFDHPETWHPPTTSQ